MGGYHIGGLNRLRRVFFDGFLSRRAGTALGAFGRNEPDESPMNRDKLLADLRAAGEGGRRMPARRRRYGAGGAGAPVLWAGPASAGRGRNRVEAAAGAGFFAD